MAASRPTKRLFNKKISLNPHSSLTIFHALLGKGGSAQVHLGCLETPDEKDNNKKSNVAIKVFNSWYDPRSAEQEATNLRTLTSPYTIRYIAFFTHEETPILVSEFMQGSLENELSKDKKIFQGLELLTVSLDIAKGMELIHFNAMVHRDIKPNNIFFNAVEGTSDDRRAYKIGDFGASIQYGAPVNLYGSTPDYVPPEALHTGKCIPASPAWDVYSFGITLLIMAAGHERFYLEPALLEIYKLLDRQEIVPLALVAKKDPSQFLMINKGIQGCSSEIISLILMCCTLNPDKRPTAGFVVKALTCLSTRFQEMNAEKKDDHRRIKFFPEVKTYEKAIKEAKRQVDKSVPTRIVYGC